MIRSLEDAETWYRAVRSLAYEMGSLAGIWDDPALEKVLGRNNRLRDVTSADLRAKSKTILDDLDDLAVLVLFSVFEATVRARSEADVDREMARLQHPAIVSTVKDLKDAIRNGSFGKVTAAYRAMDSALTEEVNQVRKFRNWVAHGRRELPENHVDPERAFERLQRYLTRLAEVSAAGTVSAPVDEPPDSTTGPGA